MRRRLTSSPVPLFKTEAVVNEGQWRELQRMAAEPRTARRYLYSFPHPSGEGTAYGLLIEVFLCSQAYHSMGSAKARKAYHVEVLFEDKTQQVSSLKKLTEEGP